MSQFNVGDDVMSRFNVNQITPRAALEEQQDEEKPGDDDDAINVVFSSNNLEAESVLPSDEPNPKRRTVE